LILLARIIHIIIGLFFISCLIYLFISAFSPELTFWTYFSFVSITLEGLLLFANKGECPLTLFQNRLGDNKGFFDLFLPNKALPYVIPVFSVLTTLATVLIYFKHFYNNG
jgi:hypothetical protein